MKRFAIFIVVIVLASPVFAGEIIDRDYISSADGSIQNYLLFVPDGLIEGMARNYSLLIWLPPGNPQPDVRFPDMEQFQKENLLEYAEPEIAIMVFEPRVLPTGGKSTFYIDTRTSPGETDVLDAISDCKEFLAGINVRGIYPEHLFLVGGSMGGLGSLSIALRNPGMFRGAYVFAPPTDMIAEMIEVWDRYDSGEVQWATQILSDIYYVFGGRPGDNPEADQNYKNASALYLIQDYPQRAYRGWRMFRRVNPLSIFIVHGMQDTLVPPDTQFWPMFEALKKRGQDSALRWSVINLPEGRHDESSVSLLGALTFVKEKQKTFYW